jgi:hypothetical protein
VRAFQREPRSRRLAFGGVCVVATLRMNVNATQMQSIYRPNSASARKFSPSQIFCRKILLTTSCGYDTFISWFAPERPTRGELSIWLSNGQFRMSHARAFFRLRQNELNQTQRSSEHRRSLALHGLVVLTILPQAKDAIFRKESKKPC